jgi:hypothetical protein
MALWCGYSNTEELRAELAQASRETPHLVELNPLAIGQNTEWPARQPLLLLGQQARQDVRCGLFTLLSQGLH